MYSSVIEGGVVVMVMASLPRWAVYVLVHTLTSTHKYTFLTSTYASTHLCTRIHSLARPHSTEGRHLPLPP